MCGKFFENQQRWFVDELKNRAKNGRSGFSNEQRWKQQYELASTLRGVLLVAAAATKTQTSGGRAARHPAPPPASSVVPKYLSSSCLLSYNIWWWHARRRRNVVLKEEGMGAFADEWINKARRGKIRWGLVGQPLCCCLAGTCGGGRADGREISLRSLHFPLV